MKRKEWITLLVLAMLGVVVLEIFGVPTQRVLTPLGAAAGVLAMLSVVALARRGARGAALGMLLFVVGGLVVVLGPWWAQPVGVLVLVLSGILTWQHRRSLRGEPQRPSEPAPPRV